MSLPFDSPASPGADGLVRRYVESLERRIQYMESLLRAQQSGSHSPPTDSRTDSTLDFERHKANDYLEDDCCVIAASGASAESKETLDVLEMLANDMGELSVDKVRRRTVRTLEPC